MFDFEQNDTATSDSPVELINAFFYNPVPKNPRVYGRSLVFVHRDMELIGKCRDEILALLPFKSSTYTIQPSGAVCDILRRQGCSPDNATSLVFLFMTREQLATFDSLPKVKEVYTKYSGGSDYTAGKELVAINAIDGSKRIISE